MVCAVEMEAAKKIVACCNFCFFRYSFKRFYLCVGSEILFKDCNVN